MQESQKILLRLENLKNQEDQKLLSLLERIYFIEYIFNETPNDLKLPNTDLPFKQALTQAIEFIFQNTQEKQKGSAGIFFSLFQPQNKSSIQEIDEKKVNDYKLNLLKNITEFEIAIQKLDFEQKDKLLYLIQKYKQYQV